MQVPPFPSTQWATAPRPRWAGAVEITVRVVLWLLVAALVLAVLIVVAGLRAFLPIARSGSRFR